MRSKTIVFIYQDAFQLESDYMESIKLGSGFNMFLVVKYKNKIRNKTKSNLILPKILCNPATRLRSSLMEAYMIDKYESRNLTKIYLKR